ncbi:hypothetical protein N8I77_006251 [Diaporthe amygdali]|uniref:Fe2OG dioxygenase domain-containing protein n=1 Tax=Phomopsis amygdali TaxID=1214568 RepID=A0AAD9SHS8_PHOAM|nr:hypothetical protein N8I77_006251 [Diaporthe amygdali]
MKATSMNILESVILAAALVSGASASQKPIKGDFICEHPPYTVSLVSKSPLVAYLHNFITPKERAHLQEVTKDSFSRSGVTGADGEHSVRTSQSTSVAPDDVVRCIEDRALAFQGYDVQRSHVEPLQLVKYGIGQRYHFHTDWFTDLSHATADLGGNRVSSFFAYVHVSNDTTGGGTNFPILDAPRDSRWCSIVDCDEPYENGATFRPIEGNAVYWENLFPNGMGDERTLHAGLPVTTGQKIGMNIWTRQGPLSDEIRGDR